MEWWQVIIPVVIGWLLGIGTIYIREQMVENTTRKRIMKLFIAEIESNQYLLEEIKELKESTDWDELRDMKPAFAPFQKLVYLSSTDKLGVLDSPMIIGIQRYYTSIGMSEYYQSMIYQTEDKTIDLARTLTEAYYASCIGAANEGNKLLCSFYDALPSLLVEKRPIKGRIQAVYDLPHPDKTKDEGE